MERGSRLDLSLAIPHYVDNEPTEIHPSSMERGSRLDLSRAIPHSVDDEPTEIHRSCTCLNESPVVIFDSSSANQQQSEINEVELEQAASPSPSPSAEATVRQGDMNLLQQSADIRLDARKGRCPAELIDAGSKLFEGMPNVVPEPHLQNTAPLSIPQVESSSHSIPPTAGTSASQLQEAQDQILMTLKRLVPESTYVDGADVITQAKIHLCGLYTRVREDEEAGLHSGQAPALDLYDEVRTAMNHIADCKDLLISGVELEKRRQEGLNAQNEDEAEKSRASE